MRLRQIIITCCILTLFVAAFVVLQLPGNSVISNELQNAGHTLGFAALTFAALFHTTPRHMTIITICLIGVLLILIGIVIELGQWVTGRGFSTLDIAKDLLGILAGICFYFAFTLPGKTKHRLIALTAGSIMLVGSLGPSLALWLSRELSPRPPILADFEQWGVAHRIRNSGTLTTIGYHDSVWQANQTLSAAVQYLPGLWPSIQFIEPYAAWRQYGCFTFRVYNQQAETVTIKLRVDDKDLGPDDDDHMTTSRGLPPGETRVIIPLEELRLQALLEYHPGEPLMKQIRSFMFYIIHVDEPITLLIDDIALGCKD